MALRHPGPLSCTGRSWAVGAPRGTRRARARAAGRTSATAPRACRQFAPHPCRCREGSPYSSSELEKLQN